MADTSVRDGGVAESVNIIVDNEELAPIVAPKVISTLPAGIDYDLLYIHSTSNYKNYIGVHQGKLCKVDPGGVTDFYTLEAGESVASIKGIGNTLVIATDDRMFYILYKDGQYEYLGEQVPFPDFKFETELLNEDVDVSWRRMQWTPGTAGAATVNLATIAAMLDSTNNATLIADIEANNRFQFFYNDEGTGFNQVGDFDNVDHAIRMSAISEEAVRLFWANFTKSVNYYHKQGFFTAPFMIRYAVRLFDGSYTRHSVPMLISYDASKYISDLSAGLVSEKGGVLKASLSKIFSLTASLVSDFSKLEKWSDIIKGIDFAISEPIYGTPKYNGRLRNGVITEELDGGYIRVTNTTDLNYAFLEEANIEEENGRIENASIFYRIKSVDIDELRDAENVAFSSEMAKVYEAGEEGLLVQPKLTDDYLSHHKIAPSVIYEFNMRLIAANIAMTFYPGPPRFASEFTSNTSAEWVFVFYIKGDDAVGIKTHMYYQASNVYPGPWIVYPDSRCYKADVYRISGGVITRKTINMKEHPLLNCAYFFAGFNLDEYGSIYTTGADVVATIEAEGLRSCLLQNKIIQYEVSNPFHYQPSGVHTLPGGRILGVATTTKALSQGQFGQFPLYVFCSDGIWAMETAPDGTYSHIVPASRDVCINPDSITGIDGAVIFVSKRGVMLLEGSNVSCISEVMDGLHFRADSLEGVPEACATFWGSDLPDRISDDLSFIDYVSQAAIAYDYANQRLIFANYTKPYQYIYSLKSNTWHKLFAEGGLYITRTLNSYPDCYLQACDALGCPVYNFSHVDDVNDIKTRTFGIVVSRALDLDAPGVLKTIMQIKHRGHFTKYSARMVLLGSRDERNYVQVRSLKSTSYKTYKIVLFLNLLPTERLSWTDLIYNEKFNNKLR